MLFYRSDDEDEDDSDEEEEVKVQKSSVKPQKVRPPSCKPHTVCDVTNADLPDTSYHHLHTETRFSVSPLTTTFLELK